MVIDATIQVQLYFETDPTQQSIEALYPPRHKMTLPLNSINNYFEDCEIGFNYHNKLDSDR